MNVIFGFRSFAASLNNAFIAVLRVLRLGMAGRMRSGGAIAVAAHRVIPAVLSALLAGASALAVNAQPVAAQGFRGPWDEMSPPGGAGRGGVGPYAPYEAAPARRPDGADGPGMDSGAVVEMLRRRGFTNVDVVRQRGAMIIVEANGPRGERVQLVVDAPSGAISGMKVIGFGDRRY